MRRLLPLLLVLLLAGAVRAEASLADLVRDLGVADATKRSNAMVMLRNRKDPRAIPLILAALPKWGGMSRYYGVLVLDAYPPKEKKRAFRPLLASEHPYLRLAAATALYQIGERGMLERAVRTLTGMPADETTRERMLNRVNMIRTPEMRAAVRKFLAVGGRTRLIGAALNVLANQADRASIPTVRKLLGDDRAGVRAMAAAWLIRLSENEGDALAAALSTGKFESLEFSRVYSLLFSAPSIPPVVLKAVTELLEKSDNVSILSSSLRLLSRARYRRAVPAIRRLLKHRSSTISKGAFEALLALDGGLDRESLLPLLESKDPDRRLMGADGLRRLNDLKGLPAVLEILAKGDSTRRAEAARVLGGFRIAKAVGPLLDALADPHQTVRMRAASSLSSVLTSLFPYRRIDLRSTGYDYHRTPAESGPSIQRIRAFWAAHRGGDW